MKYDGAGLPLLSRKEVGREIVDGRRCAIEACVCFCVGFWLVCGVVRNDDEVVKFVRIVVLAIHTL